MLADPCGGATDDTIFGRDSLSAEDNARLDEVIAAHDPALTAVPQTISRLSSYYQALAERGARHGRRG